MVAAIYTRVSTLDQNYERQVDDLTKFAKENNYEIYPHIFADKESGFNDDRTEFLKLCQLTKDDVDIILVWELSRISREPITLLNTVSDFSKKGINIYCWKDRSYTLEDGELKGMMFVKLSFAAAMAKEEAAYLKARTRSGVKRSIENGGSYTNRKVYGYDINEKFQLVINEEEAAVVRRVYDLYKEGASERRIVTILALDGINLTYAIVRHILKNTVYIGYYDWGNGQVRAKTPAIIDEATFNQIQHLKKSRIIRGVHRDTDKLLKNLIICPNCGRHYIVKKTFETMRYMCVTQAGSHYTPKCSERTLMCDKTDDKVWNVVSKKFDTTLKEEFATPLRMELLKVLELMDQAENKINEVNQQISKLTKRFFSLDVDSEEAENAFKSKLSELEKNKKGYNNEYELLELKSTQITHQLEAIKKANPKIESKEEKYEFLHKVISKIEVLPKNLLITYVNGDTDLI